MNILNLISQLKVSRLSAECKECGEEFPLSRADLFDGLGEFPEPAELRRKEMIGELQAKLNELKRRKVSAGPGAEKKAIEVGIGKIIEKVIPAYRDFGIHISDCRPLFEPIDMIIFNGLNTASIQSITFMEIKTGKSKLGERERLIKDAVSDGKVGYQVVRMNQILSTFQAFRRVLCLCPHCKAILRLSDLQLKYRGVAPKTWLDTFETKLSSAEEKEALFDESEAKLREQAKERGRRKVPIIIRKSMDSQFAKLKYNPYDIKALLHPVDFVVFDGLESKEDLRKIVFLSKAVNNEQLNGLRSSIEKTVEERKYNWQVARVSIDGKIEMTES